MKRKRLLLLLALLMTAATGAWAQDAKHVITATYDKQTRLLEQPLPYETTVGALYEAVTGQSFNDFISFLSAAYQLTLTGISSNDDSVVSIGELNGASTPVTVTADGKATVILHFGNFAQGIHVSVVPPLYVTMADGTKDADKWTATVGTNSNAKTLPIGGLKGDGSETVTLTYGGRLKVKGVTATSAPSVPDGAINGKFSVSDTKQVYFSKGNLQYDGTNWKFAASQWEVLGANGTGANGTATDYPMDLFTWGNIDSPTFNGTTYYTENADLSGITDWGSRMGSGWYTLSSAEWTYLFNTRTVNGGTGSGKSYTLGQSVNGKLGVVIYPDNYTGEVYSGSDWATFESAGCVFLPIAGLRGVGGGANVGYVGARGCYWSSTNDNDHAYYVNFDTSALSPQIVSNRVYGLSVRLVREVATTDPEPDPLATPLTIEAVTPGTIVVNINGTLSSDMKYSVNGNTPTLIKTTTPIEGLTAGDKVQFYGNGTQTQVYGGIPMVSIQGDGFQTKVYGNIMSLLDETGFATKTNLQNYAFFGLFAGNTTLIDASELLLPATTLAEQCYVLMFAGCTSLTKAPKLPATTLATDCYYGMFEGCTALTKAPKLPATTLAEGCYWGMFSGCTSLTNAYVKAAYTDLTDECGDMFDGCTATGAVLHTTPDSKASWENTMGSGNWTVADDWQD